MLRTLRELWIWLTEELVMEPKHEKGILYIVCPIHGKPYSLTYDAIYKRELIMERAINFQLAHKDFCGQETTIEDKPRL